MASYTNSIPPFASREQSKRKRTAKAGANNASASPATPVFLRKTYDMINTCDPTIASWYDNGTTFVVKDPDLFSTVVIPQYFKHNKFTSFVRQLNFYGFRKIKSDPLRIQDAEESEESNYWKFRHPKFLKGRPELLSEIRKSQQNETVDKQEFDELKRENSQLRSRVDTLSEDVNKMKAVMGVLLKNQGLNFQDFAITPGAALVKKRRVVSDEFSQPVAAAAPEPALMPLSVASGFAAEQPLQQMAVPKPQGLQQREMSTRSHLSMDDEILDALAEMDPDDLSFVEEMANAIEV